MGWENVFHCEINPFCNKILKYYWPNAATHTDIKSTDFTIYRGLVDIVTGGFPCQPYSQTGKRKGTEDERNLWPEMLRAICEIQPRYIVGENVPGLVNWSNGLVFEQVQTDLEAAGYEVKPFLLPAAGVDAPHTRERIWFVAYSSRYGGSQKTEPGRKQNEKDNEQSERIHDKKSATNTESNRSNRRCANSEWKKKHPEVGDSVFMEASGPGSVGTITNANIERLSTELQPKINGKKKREDSERYVEQYTGNDRGTLQNKGWENFPTEPPVCDGDDGLSGRLGTLTFPQWRIKSIMAGGNAIVPQVVHQIFKAIELFNQAI